MRRNDISEAVGLFVSLSGVIVMVGWFFDIKILKSILPVWASMKFSTALSFFLSGISLYFIARFQKKDRELAVIIIPIASMVTLLIMTSLLTSTMLGVNVGVEEMFVKDSMAAVGSVTPGRPSVATMMNFFLMAIAGIFITMDIKKLNKASVIFGVIVAVTGLTAILGYSINQPLFYFALPGKSSAMALHTAIIFVFWSIGLVLIERDK